ncbi:MAG: ferredoxin [Acidimicrobiaceae bacterium]|jgi:ferredoxin|nr:ferredoxin [Acidimicrobiaceae bacterium]
MGVRLRIDPVACDAFGYCAELLPDLLRLDEWGYPIVADGVVPPELARQAAASCPRRAVLVEVDRPRRGATGGRSAQVRL